MQPTTSEINDAKQYLRRRLNAEMSMEHRLEALLMQAAREIVAFAYERNIPSTLFSFQYDTLLTYEVDRIIARLRQQIEEYDILMATSTDKAERSDLLSYIYRDIDGYTYSDRLTLYTDRFKQELQLFIAAGLVAGFTKEQTISEIAKGYKQPYKGTILADKPHPSGFTSFTRLLILTRHTIAEAWMHADMEQAIRGGATGFITYRGSNYPCDVCSDYAGVFHTFAEPYPPLHCNCKCYAIPVYSKME